MGQLEQGSMRLPFLENKSEMKGRHKLSVQRRLRKSNPLEQRIAKFEGVNNLLPPLLASCCPLLTPLMVFCRPLLPPLLVFCRPLQPPLLVLRRPLQPPLLASCRCPMTLLKHEKPTAVVAPLTPPYCQVPIPFSDSNNNLVLPFRGRMRSQHRAADQFQNRSL